jgi:hypothetical protein
MSQQAECGQFAARDRGWVGWRTGVLRTGAEYRESICDGGEIRIDGERGADVATLGVFIGQTVDVETAAPRAATPPPPIHANRGDSAPRLVAVPSR